MKNYQHQPQCPRISDCSVCYPTHLEQLVSQYGPLSIREGFSAPFVITLSDGKEVSGETLELIALNILKGYQ